MVTSLQNPRFISRLLYQIVTPIQGFNNFYHHLPPSFGVRPLTNDFSALSYDAGREKDHGTERRGCVGISLIVTPSHDQCNPVSAIELRCSIMLYSDQPLFMHELWGRQKKGVVSPI